MTTIRSRRSPPGTRTRTFKAGSGNLQRTISQSISGTLLTNAVVGSPEVTITTNRLEAVSPASFYVIASATGFGLDPAGIGPLADELAHYTDLRYEWDFDEEGKVYTRIEDGENFIWDRVFDIDGVTVKWNKPGHPSDDPAYSGSTITFLGIDKNKAFGPHTGVVYAPTAEDYATEKASSGNDYIDKTIRVKVLSKAMANAGDPPIEQTLSVRLHNPDVVFGDANTVYISPTSDFPAGASNTEVTFDAALVAHGNKENIRFLFNRGEEHDPTAPNASWPNEANTDNLQFGAYGTGSDPLLLGSPSGIALRGKKNPESHACVWGLEFKGPHNSAAPWDPSPYASLTEGLEGGRFCNFMTVWDCALSGYAIDFFQNKDTRNAGYSNVYFGDNWNLGFYSDIGSSNINFSGCSFLKGWDVIVGKQSDFKDQAYYPHHGAFRMSHAGRAGEYLGYTSHNACYLRSNGGWGGGHQPSMRMGGQGKIDGPGVLRTNMDRLLSTNGYIIGNGNFLNTMYSHMQVWDKIVVVMLDSTADGAFTSFGAPGGYARNAVHIIANTPALLKPIGTVFKTEYKDGLPVDPSLTQYPIKIRGTLTLDLRDTANFEDTRFEYPSFTEIIHTDVCYSEFIYEGNLIHTPNRADTTNDYDQSNMPLQEVIIGSGHDYPGLRLETDPITRDDPLAADPRPVALDTAYASSQQAVVYVPQPGSPAYQTADPNTCPIDDLYGNIRPAMNPSKGPIEPTSI